MHFGLSKIRFVGFVLTLWGVFCFSLFSVMAADSASTNKCPGVFERELKLGFVGEDVRQLQSYLNSSDFAVAVSGPGARGSETTFFGSLTKIALTKFQTANGLAATGSFDFATQGFLGCVKATDNASEFGRDLQLGMQGEDVLRLQQYLNSQGFQLAASGMGSPGNETSYFGRLTQEAVKRLQLARGVPADGIFRPSLITPVETRVKLTYTAGLHGSISGASNQTITATGIGDRVTAVPDKRYRFVEWSDGVSTKSRMDYGRDGDKMVTANFKRRFSGGGSNPSPVVSYTLTYLAGDGGTISGVASQTVVSGGSGTEVTAVPNDGYVFMDWSDDVATESRTDSGVTANKTVTANFGSTAKAITAFTITGQTGDTVIDEDAHTIDVTMPSGTNVTALVATFMTTGASVNVGGVDQTSGVTENDFTGQVSYQVVAEDTGRQDYTVTVTVESGYALRTEGEAGGLIFYDKGEYTNGWQYLESGLVDLEPASWGTQTLDVSGAEGTLIGTGEQNTADIVTGDPLGDTAADACANYSYGGYDDWFLPSKDELREMYDQLAFYSVGDFNVDGSNYWSSSEASSEMQADYAFQMDMLEGFQSAGWKSQNPQLIRPVRAF